MSRVRMHGFLVQFKRKMIQATPTRTKHLKSTTVNPFKPIMKGQREDSRLDIDYDEFNETILQRIVALKDIVSPMKRYRMEKIITVGTDHAKSLGYYLGQFGYVLASSMILVALPIAFEMEKDATLKEQLPDADSSDLLLSNE
eukprot:NODE_8_length_66115_cov_0.981823.p49 type:complete len:143 gc:universal NODE_8_length_66115_cov_0.981823:47988-47560(-)